MSPPSQPALLVLRLIREHELQPVYAFRSIEMQHFQQEDGTPSLKSFEAHATKVAGKASFITVNSRIDSWHNLTRVFKSHSAVREKMYKIDDNLFVGGVSHPGSATHCEGLLYAIVRHTSQPILHVQNHELPEIPVCDLFEQLNPSGDLDLNSVHGSASSTQGSTDWSLAENIQPYPTLDSAQLLCFNQNEWIAYGTVLVQYRRLDLNTIRMWTIDTSIPTPDGLLHEVICDGRLGGMVTTQEAANVLQKAIEAGRIILPMDATSIMSNSHTSMSSSDFRS